MARRKASEYKTFLSKNNNRMHLMGFSLSDSPSIHYDSTKHCYDVSIVIMTNNWNKHLYLYMYALDYDDDYATMFKCEHERERNLRKKIYEEFQ